MSSHIRPPQSPRASQTQRHEGTAQKRPSARRRATDASESSVESVPSERYARSGSTGSIENGRASSRQGKAELPPPSSPARMSTREKKKASAAPKSDFVMQDHTAHTTRQSPWSSDQGPTLTTHQQEAVLNDAAALHALHAEANKTSRLVKWASLVAGVGVGLAAGIGLAVATGPAGLLAGPVLGAAAHLGVRKFFPNRARAQVQANAQSFLGNYGALLRTAKADPAVASMLDANPKFQQLRELASHYTFLLPHASLSDSYHGPQAGGHSPELFAASAGGLKPFVDNGRFDHD